ncbi:MAG: substrate-binding domain-containing protein [Lachnospiraceae bacterium]|nr:substrate-binding domain-containing protein [Lachnospiraceae bacterium]
MTVFWIVIAVIELIIIIVGLVFSVINKKNQSVMVDNAQQLVKGRLNIDDIPVSGNKSSFDIVSSGLNLIKSNLLTFIEATKQNTVVLSDAIDKLSSNMEANQVGSNKIAKNTLRVEERTAKQLEMVQDNMAVIESNSAQIEEIGESMKRIGEMLKDTAKISTDGMSNLEGYANEMDAVSKDLNNINSTLNRFNDQIQKVYEVGDFIVGISNQLKLLSFNASIEAARAGQAGKGFAVVADEMTDMSEQTRDGMERINAILSDIMQSSSSVTESIAKCTDTYNNSKSTFGEVTRSFTTINTNSIETQDKVSKITDMFTVMEGNSEQSKTIATQLYEAAHDINEMTGEIASISQEVSAEATQLGDNTVALDGMLAGIQRLLRRFDTGVLPTRNKPNKEIKIAMLSMYDNDFWYGVKRGANYALKELAELNAKVKFVPLIAGDTDFDEMVRGNIRSLIADGYDAIIYPGFLGGLDSVLEQAKAKGIKLMTFNCDCANPSLRLACLKSDSISQGEMAAKAAADLIGKNGQVGILMGDPTVIGNVERKQGFIDKISKYKGIKISGEVVVEDDGEDVYKKTKAWLEKDSAVQILFLTNGFPEDAARAVVDAKRSGKTMIIGFDLNPALFPYIKNGSIGTIISQDSFGQGHDPIVMMYNHIVDRKPFPAEVISCRASVADASNIDDLIEG